MMHKQILTELKEIENKHHVSILYACESGSRAWGFASIDSDYDVRFIYCHSVEWYLSIGKARDVIELPVDAVLDINGWDLRKALGLLFKGNTPIYEWLQSPIIYQANQIFGDKLRELAPDYISLRGALHHYHNATLNAWSYLQQEFVPLKKYFYALRAALSAQWILEQYTLPPIEFKDLCQLLKKQPELLEIIDNLLIQKHHTAEKKLISPIQALDKFLKDHLDLCQRSFHKFPVQRSDFEALNCLFRTTLHSETHASASK